MPYTGKPPSRQLGIGRAGDSQVASVGGTAAPGHKPIERSSMLCQPAVRAQRLTAVLLPLTHGVAPPHTEPHTLTAAIVATGARAQSPKVTNAASASVLELWPYLPVRARGTPVMPLVRTWNGWAVLVAGSASSAAGSMQCVKPSGRGCQTQP